MKCSSWGMGICGGFEAFLFLFIICVARGTMDSRLERDSGCSYLGFDNISANSANLTMYN